MFRIPQEFWTKESTLKYLFQSKIVKVYQIILYVAPET